MSNLIIRDFSISYYLYMMMMSSSSIYGSPFTASQWEELEQQALIFKYMVSGVPIPSDLIFHIKKNMFLPHQPMNWGCFEMGFGRQAADPEPGRCRRTDGKKWRCSREACPDSKYCEKHMHRGRNRSRKPVELINSSNTFNNNNSSFSKYSNENYNQNNHISSLKAHGIDLSLQHSNSDLGIDSYGCPSLAHKDDRNKRSCGLKEQMNEHIPDSSFDDNSRRLKMRSSAPSQQSEQSEIQFEGLTDHFKDQESQLREQHWFVLGTDLKNEKTVKAGEGETEKPFKHFFLDKLSSENRGTWLDSDLVKTKLSISIPDSNSRTSDY